MPSNKSEPEELADELDLLLQIVFHAQIAKENNQFGMEDVLNAICQKMIRRHPHVFRTPKWTRFKTSWLIGKKLKARKK